MNVAWTLTSACPTVTSTAVCPVTLMNKFRNDVWRLTQYTYMYACVHKCLWTATADVGWMFCFVSKIVSCSRHVCVHSRIHLIVLIKVQTECVLRPKPYFRNTARTIDNRISVVHSPVQTEFILRSHRCVCVWWCGDRALVNTVPKFECKQIDPTNVWGQNTFFFRLCA